MVGFGISGVKPSGIATELVGQSVSHLLGWLAACTFA
jgi:hypothetical protein